MMTKLKLGDIIVFKSEEDDWLSRSIAWFSGTDTDHSAMLYKEDAIIELISNGVCVHEVALSSGEDAYVMRLEQEPDPEPLLRKAKAYLDAKTRYDFPALILLAGYLTFRKIQPGRKLFRIAGKILAYVCLEWDNILQRGSKKPAGRAMVCSQFVYQVYQDCGEEYRIDIHYEGQKISDKMIFGKENDAAGYVCLADLLAENESGNELGNKSGNESGEVSGKMSWQDSTEDVELLLQQLYEALQEPGDCFAYELNEAAYVEVLPYAQEFINRLKKLLNDLNADVPIDSLFVTPGDLVYNAANLKRIGSIGLKRIM